MRLYDESFSALSFSGFNVFGAPVVDPVSSIHGPALKFACGAINCIEKQLPSPHINFYKSLHVYYDNTTAENGILQWRDATNGIGDLRFNALGQIEVRINAVVVKTTVQTFAPLTLYHLQIWLVYSDTAGRVVLRINNSPVPALQFFGATKLGGMSATIQFFRYGSFAATGSGNGWIDDVVVNNAVRTATTLLADATWPGMLALVAQDPISIIAAHNEFIADPVTADKWLNVVDKPDDGDSSVVKTSLTGARQAFGFADAVPIPGAVVHAVKYEVVIRADLANQEGIVRLGFLNSTGPYADEVQSVTLNGVTTPWQLTLEGYATAFIQANPTATNVQVALRALAAVHPAGATVTGSIGGPFTVTFTNHLTKTVLGLMVGSSAAGTVSVARIATGLGIKYGGVPFGPNQVDLTDTYDEKLPGTGYVKRVARRRKASDGQKWTTESANASQLVLLGQKLNSV